MLTTEEIEATRKILTRDIQAKTGDSRANAWRAGPGLAARSVMQHCDSLAAHDTAMEALAAYERVEALLKPHKGYGAQFFSREQILRALSGDA
jgi:hypothetical protein